MSVFSAATTFCRKAQKSVLCSDDVVHFDSGRALPQFRIWRPFLTSDRAEVAPDSGHFLERVAQAEARTSRLENMEMDVLDPARWLTGQSRSIKVIDVMVATVEQVKDVDISADAGPLPSRPQVHQQRSTGLTLASSTSGYLPK